MMYLHSCVKVQDLCFDNVIRTKRRDIDYFSFVSYCANNYKVGNSFRGLDKQTHNLNDSKTLKRVGVLNYEVQNVEF